MEVIKRSPSAKRKPLYTVEPEEYELKPIKGRVAIFDTETDPFSEGRVVRPFTCGFYIPDSNEYFDFWGERCIELFFDFLSGSFAEEKFTIFVHNGGNFDFYFLTQYFDEGMSPFIINGRLVRIECQGHEFRDSYSMIPVALGNALKAEDGGKIEIDYGKMERWIDGTNCRDKHNYSAYSKYIGATKPFVYTCDTTFEGYSPRDYYRPEILRYQRQDCVALGKLVTEWLELFGNRMTMASVALPALHSFHGFETVNETTDEMLRPYYFGGRCQAFETGVIHGSFKGFDLNSSYPDVMRRIAHPIGSVPKYEKQISGRTHFARIRAWSNGALPVRLDNGSLSFPIGVNDFWACIHEINAGLETGLLRIHHVYESMYFDVETTFADFIDYFYSERLKAAAGGDEIRKLFYKLVMNSSYGKFAQDPRKYTNWLFDPVDIPTPLRCEACYVGRGLGEATRSHTQACREWALCETCSIKAGSPGDERRTSPYGWYLHTEREGRYIWARPQELRGGRGFFNVATAASITSAARASLLYGINAAVRPVYCDTDSIICEALENNPAAGISISNSELGAWKEEFRADTLAIGGKKLYACFITDPTNGIQKCVKKASKGVRLTPEQILAVASGQTVEYANPVPKFSLFKPKGANTVETSFSGVSAEFVNRTISRTVEL